MIGRSHSHENAAAGLFTFAALFFLGAMMFLLIGFGIDKFTVMSSAMFTGTHASQMRFDVVNIEMMAFRAEPIIFLIALGVNYWVGELRQFSGMVDIGAMVVATVEMITMTLIIIAFTLFGGYGLDSLMDFVNNFTIINPDLSLFMAVQYIAPVFYGVMFLILFGVIVQFVMTCVKTVDYPTYGYTG
jgi:hypothetical protein